MSNMPEVELWEEIQRCFEYVFLPDQNTRTQAEEKLSFFETQELYPLALLLGVSDKNIAPHFRQLAGSRLSHFIKARWEFDYEKKTYPPNDQTKALIRNTLCQCIGENDKKIRSAVANSLSLIARNEFPEEWPQAFEIFTNSLQSANINEVDGALSIFEEIQQDISNEHLGSFISQLFPQLYLVCTTRAKTLSIDSIESAVKIFQQCAMFCADLEDFQLIYPYLDQWLPLLGQLLQSPESPLQIKIIACETLSRLAALIPNVVNSNLQGFMEMSWNTLNNFLPVYLEKCVKEDDPESDEITKFLQKIIEFLTELMEKKTFRVAVKDHQMALVYHIVIASSMTADQCDGWVDDASEYAAVEDEFTTAYNVRIVCCDLIQIMCEKRAKETIASLVSVCQRCINEGEVGRSQGDDQWWKKVEASLLALGCVSEIALSCNISSFMNEVFNKYLSTTAGEPFLFGRVLWLVSKFKSVLDANLYEPCLLSSVHSLGSDKAAPIRVNALKSLYSLFESGNNQALEQCVSMLFTNLTSLVQGAGSHLLVLMMKVIRVAVKVNENVTLQHESTLIPLVLATWLQYNNEPDVNIAVQEVFIEISQTLCWGKLLERSVPTLLSIIKASENSLQPGMKESAVGMLGALLRGCNGPLPDILLSSFQPLIDLMSSMNDTSIIQCGCECLTLFLNHGSVQLNSINGVEAIVNVVAAVLQKSESIELAFVGPLVTKLFKKIELGPVTEPMLQACANKMTECKMWFPQQAMLSVFATLIINHFQATIEFLVRTPAQGYDNAFVMLMDKWTENHIQICGVYDKNATIIAMVNLFKTSDPMLEQIHVKGDQIFNKAEESIIMTRSKRKTMPVKYERIPLRTKMFQILVQELMLKVLPEPDDDWEDEDDDLDDSFELVDSSNIPLVEALKMGITPYDEEEAGEIDPDLKTDSIYTADIENYLAAFFTEFSNTDLTGFQTLLKTTQVEEQDLLVKYLNGTLKQQQQQQQ